MFQPYLAEKIVHAYIQEFSRDGRSDLALKRKETGLWRNLAQFQEHWDPAAANLGLMWRQSIYAPYFDTEESSPSLGIAILMKHEEEEDFIRKAFLQLFSDDSSDPTSAIEHFMEDVNSHILFYYPNSTRYLQTREAVMAYLNLKEPCRYYLYKPEVARMWADYMEYPGFEEEETVSMEKYYSMCQDLRNYIADNEELQEMHQLRFEFEDNLVNYDTDDHALTFDIMRFALPLSEIRETAITDLLRAEREEVIGQVQRKLDDTLAQLDRERQVPLIGEEVSHCRYGLGRIAAIDPDEKKLMVHFTEMDILKQFRYPNSILQNFITLTNISHSTVIPMEEKRLKTVDDLNRKIEELRQELKLLKHKPLSRPGGKETPYEYLD